MEVLMRIMHFTLHIRAFPRLTTRQVNRILVMCKYAPGIKLYSQVKIICVIHTRINPSSSQSRECITVQSST